MSARNRREKRRKQKEREAWLKHVNREMEKREARKQDTIDNGTIFLVDEMTAICNGQVLAGRFDARIPTRVGWYYWTHNDNAVRGPFTSAEVAFQQWQLHGYS